MGLCVSTGPRTPNTSPATTFTRAPGPGSVTGISSDLISWYRGGDILSARGRFTHSWSPWTRPPSRRIRSAGSSEWTMPAPAVIHCTSPGPR